MASEPTVPKRIVPFTTVPRMMREEAGAEILMLPFRFDPD